MKVHSASEGCNFVSMWHARRPRVSRRLFFRHGASLPALLTLPSPRAADRRSVHVSDSWGGRARIAHVKDIANPTARRRRAKTPKPAHRGLEYAEGGREGGRSVGPPGICSELVFPPSLGVLEECAVQLWWPRRFVVCLQKFFAKACRRI